MLKDSVLDEMIQWKMKTPMGFIYLVSSDFGIRGIFVKKQKQSLVLKLNSKITSHKWTLNTVKQLERYFAGKQKYFDLPLDISGTAFQVSVWQQLVKIPFGGLVNYQEIAKSIKSPKAVRAVGTAVGQNPLMIVIPCHRVTPKSGGIGKFSGGLARKKWLLAHEGHLKSFSKR